VRTLNFVSTNNNEIRGVVDNFVQELERLIRKQAIESVAAALGAASTGSAPRARAAGKAAAAPARPAADAFGSRKRRTAKEIDSLAASILEYVEKNPGQRSERSRPRLHPRRTGTSCQAHRGGQAPRRARSATEYFAKKRKQTLTPTALEDTLSAKRARAIAFVRTQTRVEAVPLIPDMQPPRRPSSRRSGPRRSRGWMSESSILYWAFPWLVVRRRALRPRLS
jgi:hypothetical protein